MYKQLSTIGALALGASLLGWTNEASAIACKDVPNAVVVSGSTAIKPTVAAIAPVLAGLAGSDQVSIIYQGSGSCSGVTALGADTTPTGACQAGACLTGTANYWEANTPAGSPLTCDLEAAGTHIDLILSDVFPSSCDGLTNKKYASQPLLVIPFTFIVPTASLQEAIDVREAYYAYGDGAAGMVDPWNDPNLLFQRNSGSGTQVTVFKNIHVPVGQALGVDTMGTGGMLTQVAAASNPQAALGFAGTDAVDLKRDVVKILAYRHWGQKKYYWPDSSSDSFDKKNVRDGHYPLWGYEHAMWLVDDSKKPVSARATKLAEYLSGKTSIDGSDIVLLSTQASTVPLCAMEVSRSDDGGDFSVETPDEPCTCFFEANVTGGSTDCNSCTNDNDCGGAGKCRRNYCEAR